MKHKVKITVLDKKVYPQLQQHYCSHPNAGVCPGYKVGDEFIFYRDDGRDDFQHKGCYISLHLHWLTGWMKNENQMITCCSDGKRPVIFKIERIDYE